MKYKLSCDKVCISAQFKGSGDVPFEGEMYFT